MLLEGSRLISSKAVGLAPKNLWHKYRCYRTFVSQVKKDFICNQIGEIRRLSETEIYDSAFLYVR